MIYLRFFSKWVENGGVQSSWNRPIAQRYLCHLTFVAIKSKKIQLGCNVGTLAARGIVNDVIELARVCLGLLYIQYACTTKTLCNVKGDDIHPEVNRDGQC